MSDSFEERGDAAPDTLNTTIEAAIDTVEATVADAGPVDASAFAALGLAPELVAAVADLGYTQPTAVQARVMPKALLAEGETRHADLMVSSQTGSGKTAAFLLPVLHTLLQQRAEATARERAERDRLAAEALARGEAPPKAPKRKDPTNPRHFKAATPGALVLCPTRELAQQVAHDAIDLVRHCRGLRVANVVGGMPYQLQIAKLQNADLVVATPGRLLDLQRSQQLKLDEVQFLVVDEADRMLDLGFADDLAEVNLLTAQRRQTMMFSATFAPRIQQLAMRVMHDNGSQVQKIQIDSPQEQHANIKQVLFWADTADHKRKMLDHWLRDATINQAIVFASTQIECDGLANDLQQAGFSAVALHGALSQGIRNRRLMALRNGQVQILVATDVAARGIDVPTITHVFNFGLPMKAEDYTHRIGRTGRAGRDGLAVTFAEQRDRRRIADIEAYTRQRFTAEVIPGLEPRMRAPQPEFGRGRPGGDRFGGRNDRGGDRRSGPPSRGPRFENRDSAPRFDPRGDSRGEFRAGPRNDFRGDAPMVDRSRPDGRFDPRFEGREAPAFEGRGAPRGDFRDQRAAPRSFDDRAPARAGKPGGFSSGRTDKPAFADRGGERNYADRSGFNDRGSRPAPRRAPR
ncbi:MAG: DEAD/DEAH box helicase [Comamonadaceae bacterium]|jgi:superfamily II DNA/RNA helicase|nr:DEAD/DEAH box helicase [Comamonadaceae bacterium]